MYRIVAGANHGLQINGNKDSAVFTLYFIFLFIFILVDVVCFFCERESETDYLSFL